VATPIGNLRDITLRALDILQLADAIACEDTRVTGKLTQAYGIKAKLLRYDDHTGERARPEILERLAAGQIVALVSDAGTPLISDPGYRLVRMAVEAGYAVTALPGASALLTALAVAGLPTDRFLFAGFPGRRSGERLSDLKDLARIDATLVFYEAPSRLAASLADMATALGDRPAAIARELTKLYEEVRRDSLSALAAHYEKSGPPKGEIVIIVGPPLAEAPDEQAIDALLLDALSHLSVRDAAEAVSAATGSSKRAVYNRALALSK
jgi:16S rRNA (cytidine1402-2'-O)-methyltransferase